MESPVYSLLTAIIIPFVFYYPNIAIYATIIKKKGKKMKPIRNVFISREDRKKYVCIGHSFNTEKSYTRADFLPPSKVATKFGLSLDEAKKIMQKLRTSKQIFVLNDHKCTIIVKFSKTSGLYLHPMAQEAFRQHLEKQRN
jgi:hypothetical protein